MKTLPVVGTAAMFLVGGGILLHGIPHSHDFVDAVIAVLSFNNGFMALLIPSMLNAILGIAAGGLLVLIFWLIKKVKPEH
jgi:predicted DNA repair protein MutK